jgi:sugar/nucleoside kinase (ribokinase family)
MTDVLFLQYPICDVHVGLTESLPLRAGQTNPAKRVRLMPGGGATTVFVAARLGLQVTQVGVVGDDDIGDLLLDGYRQEGASVTGITRQGGYATPCAVVLNDPSGAHAFASVLDGQYPSASELTTAVEGSRLVLVSGYLFRSLEHENAALAAAHHARSRGIPVALDPGPIRHDRFIINRWLAVTDILVLNETEAAHWTGSSTEETAAEELAGAMPTGSTVVIKSGARGCYIRRGEEAGWHAGFQVALVDTTGAGDSFIAGLLYGLLRGLAIEESARIANAAGAATTAKVGCGPDAATRAEILQLQTAGSAQGIRLRPRN